MGDDNNYRKVRRWKRTVAFAFFKDEKIHKLKQPLEKLTALYLLTGQCNRIGCYSFSPAMAAEDLGVTVEEFTGYCRKVCRLLRWKWDETCGVVFIPTWWKHNPPNSWKDYVGYLNDLERLPNSRLVYEFACHTVWLDGELVDDHREAIGRILGYLPETMGRAPDRIEQSRVEQSGGEETPPPLREGEPSSSGNLHHSGSEERDDTTESADKEDY